MLRYLTAGESHGPALTVVVEGLPAGLPSPSTQIGDELARRRLGFGRGPRMRFERDDVEFLGGVRHGAHARLAGLDRDPQHRVAEVAGGDVARARASPRSRCTSPGPATPTSSACRSTASTTPATCSSGPAPARPRPGSPPARWPRRSSPQLGTDGPEPRGPDGRRPRAPAERPAHAGRPRRGRRLAGALLRPGGRGRDDRRDRGRGEGRRLARRRGRGARLRRAARARRRTCTGTARSTACSRRRS